MALANNTRYGLAASVWSESAAVSLDIAASLRAGVVWINSTNVFDAAAAFGGQRESGFGREGAREGMAAYLTRKPGKTRAEHALPSLSGLPGDGAMPEGIDRTAKLYVGGKQVRPDGGQSFTIRGAKGPVGLAGIGSRKDIRNAVEAARKAEGWSGQTGHARAQVLYFLGENLSARAAEFSRRLESFGQSRHEAEAEVAASIRRIFWYAAQADKIDGAARKPIRNHLTLAMPEPLGVIGIACPASHPLLGLLSLALPAIAAGNRIVAIPSQTHPLAATDLCQVFDTSDLPGGVVNIVTGERDALARVLAEHDDVEAVWYAGSPEGAKAVEEASAGNLKQTWCLPGGSDWMAAQGREFLDRAVQVKTVWIPFGA